MKNNYRKTSCIRSKKQISNYVLLLVVLLMCSSSLKAQVPSYVPTNGLVGWWPFNGNANDESGNGNNGTVNGATLTSDRNGQTNSAYSFDGINSNILVTALNSMAYKPVTYNLWFNPDSLNTITYPGGGGLVLIGRDWSGNFDQGALMIFDYPSIGVNNKISYYVGQSISSTSFTPNINSWQCLTFTISSQDSLKYYINGSLISSEYYQTNGNVNAPFKFGAGTDPNINSNRFLFNGIIDDIGIWSRALTQQEITALYNGCQLSINTQPTNQTITVNNNAQFIVSSSDPNASYQWQTDLGIGFQNLSSVGQYSGATNDTLTVSYATFANNNQPFRCIVSSGSCSDTSNVAVLTVNNNVGINEISQNQLFSVYPNPTSTVIHLKSDAQLLGATYFVYDNLGKIILSGKVTSENMPIDLNQLAEGNYLIGIESNGVQSKKQSIKVIK